MIVFSFVFVVIFQVIWGDECLVMELQQCGVYWDVDI